MKILTQTIYMVIVILMGGYCFYNSPVQAATDEDYRDLRPYNGNDTVFLTYCQENNITNPIEEDFNHFLDVFMETDEYYTFLEQHNFE